MSSFSGKLLLAATPIGNYADASTRLRIALQSADMIAAEDTRKAKNLLNNLKVVFSGKIISFYEHNENFRIQEILATVREGKTVVVISDAGMPVVNDPGYSLVQASIRAGIEPQCLPGPSAILTALILSGLPANKFIFEGFVPRKLGDKQKIFQKLLTEERTVIFFESPRRVGNTLKVAEKILGADRPTVVARELTKVHEEIIRGSLGELTEQITADLKGEIVLLIGGGETKSVSLVAASEQVANLITKGEKLKAACKQVADITGISANQLYQYYLTGSRK